MENDDFCPAGGTPGRVACGIDENLAHLWDKEIAKGAKFLWEVYLNHYVLKGWATYETSVPPPIFSLPALKISPCPLPKSPKRHTDPLIFCEA